MTQSGELMNSILEIVGFVGVAVSCFAYVPQIIHLATEHCSAGVSVRAWILWLLAAFLISLHAFSVFDIVFVALQIVNIVAITPAGSRFGECEAQAVSCRVNVGSAHNIAGLQCIELASKRSTPRNGKSLRLRIKLKQKYFYN